MITIFGKKIGVFLKYQCYDQLLQNLALFWVKNANFFRKNFRRKYFKNNNIGPWSELTPSPKKKSILLRFNVDIQIADIQKVEI
jgi:hypothetical protein